MRRACFVLPLLLLAEAGCGRSIPQIRAQAAEELRCPPERILLVDAGGWRYHVMGVLGCKGELMYECYGPDQPCRRGLLGGLVESQPPVQRVYQPQPSQPVQPSSPGSMGIVPPGSYNPRTGTMQHSYSDQYSTPSPPPPVYRPPPPAYTPSYTPSYRR